MKSLEAILTSFSEGTIDLEHATREVRRAFFEPESGLTLDHDREHRTGAPEVIYGEGKSSEQLIAAVSAISRRKQNVLATRISETAAEAVLNRFDSAEYFPIANLLSLRVVPFPTVETTVCVVSAGTSDQRVAEEAALTAEFYGSPVVRIRDVGVAGIHRLLARLEELRASKVIIAVAGMEGALPSAVGGLVDKPVIAVPTSVGYGAALGGIAALLGMLTSCAAGVSVVNIDNGFGAGFLANRINRLGS